MAEIRTPVKGFTGQVAGVQFTDGVGETEDVAALAYFERHGYDIVPEEQEPDPLYPEGDPTEKWTVDQLKAYATTNGIDLKGATTKADILLAVGGEAPKA